MATRLVLLPGFVVAAMTALAPPAAGAQSVPPLPPVRANVAPPASDGTVVLMSGTAELEVPNDEAVANFFVEVQEADAARAQSLVNQRVAEGTSQLKRADPKAQLETSGYQSYPVYSSGSGRKIVGWRARQGVTLRTTDLAALPKTVSAGQQQMALGGIDFRLSRAARERVEAELIRLAIANLNARVAAVARALDVPPARMRIEELDFGVRPEQPPIRPLGRAAMAAADSVAEPQFEAGKSLQQMNVTARVRFAGP
ncbi:MAG TPA: SIMPL domain-containing protein [Burkholderiaceae bacterium]|nr:SIMPL domain-containing protein [Burkholderiaceae bacterium]